MGHACLLVESEGSVILIDPNLRESFREETFRFCPDRIVHLERLPPPDVILLSHRHRDHFDLASLTHFDRKTPIIYPQDPLMTYGLKQLGFVELMPTGDWEQYIRGDVSVVTTESCFADASSDYQEHGFLISSPDAVVWNLADTIVTPEIISAVSKVAPDLDVIFYPFQPTRQLEVVTNRTTSFPYADYSQRLRHLNYLKPKTLVPSSSGYRVAGANEWVNHFKFPVSRGQFLADVEAHWPEINVLVMDPGDSIQKENGQFVLLRQGATNGFVETRTDDTAERLFFNPVARIDPIVDPNVNGYNATTVRDQIHETFSTWIDYINSDIERWAVWIEWGLTYRFRIIYANTEESLVVDFSSHQVRLSEAVPDRVDFQMDCAASTLFGLMTGRMHFDHQMAGSIRTFSCMYRTSKYGVHSLAELVPEYSEEVLDAFGLLRRLLNLDGKHPYRVMDWELGRLTKAAAKGK